PTRGAPRPGLVAVAIRLARERAPAHCLHQPPQGQVGPRNRLLSVVQGPGIPFAPMVGVTPEIMRQGMRADYRRVDALSQRLCERMRHAEGLRVTTPAGTSFTASFDPSLAWIKTSGLISSRYWSNLPAGEVFTTPASVDGTFICNATAGDYFGPKYGDLSATPLVLELRGGRLADARSSRADLQHEFWAYCHTDAY